MWKRLVVALLLLTATLGTKAAEYTDVYYDPAETGWGVLLIQSNTFQFLTFFIYGQDGKPTWYTAQITDDGTGTYTGPLYAITGTYFADPWQGYNIGQVGTASFQPTDPYHARLTYTVNGVAGPIVKTVQRQTLRPYVLAGDYSGSMAGSITGCSDPTLNEPSFRGRYSLQVTQNADVSATLTFAFVDAANASIVCSVSGPLTHLGRLYQMANAAIACTGPGQDGQPRPVTVNSFHPTGQGIEGRFATSLVGGCSASLHFAAVLNVNN